MTDVPQPLSTPGEDPTKALERRNRQLALLNRIIAATAAHLEPRAVLGAVCSELATWFGAPQVAAALLNDEGTESVVVAEYLAPGRPSAMGHVIPLAGNPSSQQVIGEHVPVGVVDAQHDPRLKAVHHLMRERGTVSILILPLLVRGRSVGTIGLDLTVRHVFTDEEMDLALNAALASAPALENARLFADMQAAEDALREQNEYLAALAAENARLLGAERTARDQAETLRRANLALSTTMDLQQALDAILRELQAVVPYDSASVQVLRDGRLEIIGGTGFANLDELIGVTFDPSALDSPNGIVIRSREPLIVENASASYAEFRRDVHQAAQIASWLGWPLLFGDRVIGMIALDKHEAGFYTEDHARVALAFGAQAAVAIENARLFDEVRAARQEAEAANEAKSDFLANDEPRDPDADERA